MKRAARRGPPRGRGGRSLAAVRRGRPPRAPRGPAGMREGGRALFFPAFIFLFAFFFLVVFFLNVLFFSDFFFYLLPSVISLFISLFSSLFPSNYSSSPTFPLPSFPFLQDRVRCDKCINGRNENPCISEDDVIETSQIHLLHWEDIHFCSNLLSFPPIHRPVLLLPPFSSFLSPLFAFLCSLPHSPFPFGFSLLFTLFSPSPSSFP